MSSNTNVLRNLRRKRGNPPPKPRAIRIKRRKLTKESVNIKGKDKVNN